MDGGIFYIYNITFIFGIALNTSISTQLKNIPLIYHFSATYFHFNPSLIFSHFPHIFIFATFKFHSCIFLFPFLPFHVILNPLHINALHHFYPISHLIPHRKIKPLDTISFEPLSLTYPHYTLILFNPLYTNALDLFYASCLLTSHVFNLQIAIPLYITSFKPIFTHHLIPFCLLYFYKASCLYEKYVKNILINCKCKIKHHYIKII